MRPNEFSLTTQELALARQGFRCASCGTGIFALGEVGRTDHKYGEIAHAHHMVPVRLGGTDQVQNCVILCQACHYNAHEGGRYQHGTVVARKEDFPYYSN